MRAAPRRFLLRRVWRELVLNAVDVDRGVLFTFGSLLRQRGGTVRAYLAERTGRYRNSVKYLIISLAGRFMPLANLRKDVLSAAYRS